MASGLSQRCIGALWNQPSIGLTLSRPSRSQIWAKPDFRARRYATAAAKHKPKAPSTAAGTSKPIASKPAPKTKVSAKSTSTTASTAKGATQRGNDSALSKPVSQVSSQKQQPPTTASPPKKSKFFKAHGKLSYKVAEDNELPEAGQPTLAQEEHIVAASRLLNVDPWGGTVGTLDVTIPHSLSPTRLRSYPGLQAIYDQFMLNLQNAGKNATCLLVLAQSNGIPGVDLSGASLIQKLITQWPWRIFTSTSTKPDGWMASLRQDALSTYKEVNTALANQNGKIIRKLSVHAYQDRLFRLLRKSQTGYKSIWRFHRELSPTRVISIRAMVGHLGNEEPRFGNRMIVHALVRFDSEQSLEMYDMWGRAVHRPAGDVAQSASTSEFGHCPAEKKRVTEYLVFEKRMWYDGPWIIREQLWETPGRVSKYT